MVDESALVDGRLIVCNIWPQVNPAIKWLQCEELENLLQNLVIESIHLSPLHTVVQLHHVCCPQDVPQWVCCVILPQVEGVELVGKQAHIVAVCQYGLCGEGVGCVQVQIEACSKQWKYTWLTTINILEK